MACLLLLFFSVPCLLRSNNIFTYVYEGLGFCLLRAHNIHPTWGQQCISIFFRLLIFVGLVVQNKVYEIELYYKE